MRIIPKASKVKVTFYKGVTIPDIVLAIISLALIAVTISSNFWFRWYLAGGILCLVAPLYLTLGEQRLYVQIAYLFRYLFSKKKLIGADVDTVSPYKEVSDGVVYNKDGSAFSAIEIDPINFGMLSCEKQDELIDYCYAKVLNIIDQDEEWVLQKVDMPLVLDKQVQSELSRAAKVREMVTSGVLTDEEFVPRCDAIQARFEEIDAMNSDSSTSPHYFLCLVGISTKAIKEKLDRAVSILEAGGIRAHRLDEQELQLLTRAGFNSDYNPRDQLKVIYAPHEVSFGPATVKQDGMAVTELAITRYPLSVPNAWGERLFCLDHTKVSMRMKPIEKAKAVKRIDNSILEIETKNIGKESQQQESEAHLETLQDLMQDIQQSNETLFDTSIIVTIYDNPKSNANRRAVKNALREMGFGFTELVGRQEDGYVSSLISTTDLLKMPHGIQTSSLAAAFPFCSDIMMDEGGTLIGQSSLPAFINFFKRDLTHVNSNLIVIGQSGSGKSYATKTVLANLATEGAKVYVLDPESEYGVLAENLGGSHIDASDGSKGRINPFEIMTTMDDEGGTSNSFYAHLQFLEQFYRVVLQGINQDSLEMLNKLTEEVYAEKDIRPGRNLAELKPEDYPTFEDLCALVDKKLSEAKDAYEENCLRTISNWVTRFRKGYRDSSLWNGETTFSSRQNFIDFDFQRLLANHNEVTANAQMLVLLKWLENEVIRNRDYNRSHHANRKVVVAIDEAHLFIDEKYPIALDFMYQLAKRIRKYDGMLIIITQNVKDFAGTPEIARKSTAIINVSQYSMIFALSPNDMTELMKLYENSGGLNSTEREAIVHNPRGTCFFISSPNERGILEIEANDYTKNLFGEGTTK